MQTPKPILLIPLCCFLSLQLASQGQSQQLKTKKDHIAEAVGAKDDLSINFTQNQVQVLNLSTEEAEKVIIFDMRGTMVTQQMIRNTTMNFDLSSFEEGVYLLVVRPRLNGKEKMMKFVIRK
jgi:hypothetical protein